MARSIKEIKNFNAGTISNADPRETPDDAPILSYNVDGNSSGGILRARKADKLKGGHIDHARMKMNTGLTVRTSSGDGGSGNWPTAVQLTGFCELIIGDYIIINDEIMLITNINQVMNDFALIGVTRGQLGTTPADLNEDDIVYRAVSPVASFTYKSEELSDKENMVVMSKNGWVDGVYDWNETLFETNEDGTESSTRIATVGQGINERLGQANLTPDFSNFPHKISHNDNPSIVAKNNVFFVGCGSSHTTKWLGRIKKANVSNLSGFLMLDDKLISPAEGGFGYDKMITFQQSLTDYTVSESVKDLTALDNTSKVIHIAFKRGTQYLVLINADTGKAYTSALLNFTIDNICKCVSSKKHLKVWAYEKGNATNIDNPGRIHLLTIPNIDHTTADGAATLGSFGLSDGWVPMLDKTINILLAPEESVPKASDVNSKNYGYDSTPLYNKGFNLNDGDEYEGGQEISDILETVDASGNGKLWILASPLDVDDEEPDKNWFRVTPYLPVTGYDENSSYGAPFCCFRFLWCSYERYDEYDNPLNHIKGDELSGGGSIDIYFNDKSFSMMQMREHGKGDTTSFTRQATIGSDWNLGGGGWTTKEKIWMRWIKREVPTPTATTYNSTAPTVDRPHYFGSYISSGNINGNGNDTADWNSQVHFNHSSPDTNYDWDENYSVLLNGGGPWYIDSRTGTNADEYPPQANTDNTHHYGKSRITYSVIEPNSTSGWNERTESKKGWTRPDWYSDNHGEHLEDSVIFKPIPNSLVDLSDLYKVPSGGNDDGSLSHVVGCYVNFHKGYLLEDLWNHMRIHRTGSATERIHGRNWGRRIRQVRGTSCLWISSGNLENYGAYYTRHANIGYKSHNTEDTQSGAVNEACDTFQDVNLSTTCCNLDKKEGATVRIYKWLPYQLPNRLTANIRNKMLSEFNIVTSSGSVSWPANTNDNNPRYSSLFLSHDNEETEDEILSGVSKFGKTIKLNTTAELGDKYEPLVHGDANVLQDVGPEKVTNGQFTNWTGGNPDDWTVHHEDGSNHISESGGGGGAAVYVSDGTSDVHITQGNVFEVGKTYRFKLECTAHTSGQVGIWHNYEGEGTLASLSGTGTIDHVFTATGTTLTINQSGASVNLTFDNVSVKEVAFGLCGYFKGSSTTNVVSATNGDIAKELSPQNTTAVFQINGTQGIPSQDDNSINVESLVDSSLVLTSAVRDLEDIIPNGPSKFVTFGRAIGTNPDDYNEGSSTVEFPNRSFMHNIDFNGFDGTQIENCFSISSLPVGAVYDNNVAFLSNNFSQSIFTGNLGPYETTDGRGSVAMNDLGYSKIFELEAHNNSLAASSFGLLTGTEESPAESTNQLMIGHVWPKGNPAGLTGTGSVSADATGNKSEYATSDYELSVFNREGTKDAFHCTLTDELDFSPTTTDDFSSSPTEGTDANKLSIYAVSKHQEASTLSDVTFSGVTTDHPTGDNTQSYADYFPQQTTKWYKLSYEYDGFQDSPLTANDYVYRNNTTDYASLDVNISLPGNIPPRVTRVNLWRKNEEGMFYYLVKSIPADAANFRPSTLGGKSILKAVVRDKGAESIAGGQDYDGYTGLSFTTTNIAANYGMSVKCGNYLFVSDVSHVNVDKPPKTTVLRSQKNKFSQFLGDSDNLLGIEEEVNAMASFNGKLYIFTDNTTVRVDPDSFTEEDVLHGFGCTSKDGVVVTEYGMFYADKNHIYQHDGANAKIISYAIEDDDFSGVDGGWKTFASSGDFKAIFLYKTNQIGFAVTYNNYTYIFCYHLLKQRWDLKKMLPSTYLDVSSQNLGLFTTKSDGSLYMFAQSSLWETESDTKDGYQWISKKFTMDADTIDKRFVKIKVEADGTIDTPVVKVDGNAVTVTSTGQTTGAGTYEYKLSGSDKKGKAIQLFWGDGTLNEATDKYNSTSTIFSIGIIYRMGKVK